MPCLYCGGPWERTDEHVLAKFLGTALVLKDDVCGRCNTRVFSGPDGELANFVRTFVPCAPSQASLPSPFFRILTQHFDSSSGTWRTVRLAGDGRPRLMTQLLFPAFGTNRCTLVLDEENVGVGLESRLDADFADLSRLHLEEALVVGLDPPMTPALVRSAPRKWIIRAPDTESVATMRRLIESGIFSRFEQKGEPRTASEHADLVGKGHLALDSVERAVAKSAVNLVCYLLGPHAARRSEAVASLARFARGPYPGRSESPVTLFFFNPPSALERAFLGRWECEGHHTVLLSPSEHGMHMMIFMFYERPFASVRLPHLRGSDIGDVAAILFNYREKTHRLYTLKADTAWFVERMERPR